MLCLCALVHCVEKHQPDLGRSSSEAAWIVWGWRRGRRVAERDRRGRTEVSCILTALAKTTDSFK
jgi:hypothetical protein